MATETEDESLHSPWQRSAGKQNVTYEWDETKAQANRDKHGVRFEAINSFDWTTAMIDRSDRQGEIRWSALGYIGDRLHSAVFTVRGGNLRIISLRKANEREKARYAGQN